MLVLLALSAFGRDSCRGALADAACATPEAVAAAWVACAAKVDDPSCRAALSGDPSEGRASCLAVLPSELADRVERASSATADERVTEMAGLLGSLRDYRREETLVAWLLALSSTVSPPQFVEPHLAEHQLTIVISAESTRVLADQVVVPCPGTCDRQALKETVLGVGALPGWEGIRQVLIAADEDVLYGRVVSVLGAIDERFPDAQFGVASDP